jgi:hypothetical protein
MSSGGTTRRGGGQETVPGGTEKRRAGSVLQAEMAIVDQQSKDSVKIRVRSHRKVHFPAFLKERILVYSFS